MSNNLEVLLVGPGNIGLDYVKVLKSFNADISVVGRSKKSSDSFTKKTDIKVHSGGIESYIKKQPIPPKYAIVAVNENQLCEVTISLLHYGVKNILVEKPGGLSFSELIRVSNESKLQKSNVYVGYNRRYYQSVQKCRELLEDNTGPINVLFEFTEWSHDIDFEHYTKSELEKFFLCNSSHVVDLVFHLFGVPKELNSNTIGTLSWHPSSAVFTGSGKTIEDVLFSYNANWSSAGRWGIEIIVDDYKLILRPLEKLFIQKKGTFDLNEIPLGSIDNSYKPGLYNEIKSFFGDSPRYLCTVDEQINNFYFYYKIANYEVT